MPVWSLRNTGIALYRVVSRKNNIVTCQTAFFCLCDAHIFMRNQIIIRERRITNRAVAWGEWGAVAIQILPIGSLHITQICMKPEGFYTYYVMCWLPITAISVLNTARGWAEPCSSKALVHG